MNNLIFISILFVCSESRSDTPFISGGRNATLGEVPWIVDLIVGEKFICGGSILNKRTILTASHCVYGKGKISVHVGSLKRSSGGINISAVNYITHPLLDMALLNLTSDIPLNNNTITRVKLPRKDTDPPGGLDVVVAGWGHSGEKNSTIFDDLQIVNNKIVSRAECKTIYGDNGSPIDKVSENMICAGGDGKGSCRGDSGGPLTHSKTIVGIVSWGLGCSMDKFPGVYTRVSKAIEWIKQNKF